MPIEMDKRYNGHKRLLGLVEPIFTRIRVMLNGEVVADTPNAYMLYDHIYAPRYLFPKQNVRMDLLTPSGEPSHNRMYNVILHHDVTVGGVTAEKAAITYADPRGEQQDIQDFVGFEWDKMSRWFVEDEEVFGHARNPFLRTDVRDSSRRVQVLVNGVTVADTTNATFLFETGLLPRYYIPVRDINSDYLRPVGTHSICPYKGTASYYNIVVDDMTVEEGAWYYPTPDRGLETLMRKVAFYNEHKDITILVADQ